MLRHQYEKRFQTLFNPLPKVVVMHMLDRLVDHRNPLMHGHACGVRALEQCVCYSNDLIDACKAFFMKINKERQYDAPTFTRFTDSNGNIFHVTAPEGQNSIFDAREGANGTLHVGDVVTFEVEIDESYPPEGYKIQWEAFYGRQLSEGSTFKVEVTNRNVSQHEEIRAALISNKNWHRSGSNDDFIIVKYRVLPVT